MNDAQQDEGRKASRGVAFIAGAKVYFLIAGLAVELILPNLLGNARFGAWHLVKSTVSLLNNVLIAGTIQTVSKFVAPHAKISGQWHGAGIKMHARIGLPIALAFALASPLVAWYYRDAEKVGPLLVAALIIALYSFYAVFVGVANGRKEFHKQAVLDMSFATMRAGLMLALAAFGLGVYGVLAGWVVAAVVILIIAAALVGMPKRPTKETPALPMAKFLGSVSFYLLLLNLMMVVDTFLLKRLATEWYWQTAGSGDGVATAAASFADNQVGYYGKVGNLARISYSALIAVTFVIFPLMSRTSFAKESDTARKYVNATLRYSLVLGAAIPAVLVANPHEIITLIYKVESANAGASALTILGFGYLAFSLFAICGAILNGAGMTRPAIVVGFIACGLGTAAAYVLIPRSLGDFSMLDRTALSISGAMVIGAVASIIVVCKRFGVALPWLPLLRVGAAAAAAIFVGRYLEFSGALMTLAECALVGIVYLVVLVGTRELTKADLSNIVMLRRSAGAAKGNQDE